MPAEPRRTVDLNADLGEEVTDDAGLLAVVTTANVACGFHAGTPETMRFACAEAARVGVVVGAQVSYRDRANFGRVAHDLPSPELRDQVAEQVATLSAIALAEGTTVRYVKPHGALYHRVTWDPEQAGAVLEGRDYVVPDDVKGRVRSVLRHRITLAPELEVEGRTVDEVVDMVVSRVKVPE